MYISQNSGFNHLCFDYPMYLSSTFHTDKGVFVYFSSTVWDNFPLLSANSHPWPFLKAKYRMHSDVIKVLKLLGNDIH